MHVQKCIKIYSVFSLSNAFSSLEIYFGMQYVISKYSVAGRLQTPDWLHADSCLIKKLRPSFQLNQKPKVIFLDGVTHWAMKMILERYFHLKDSLSICINPVILSYT